MALAVESAARAVNYWGSQPVEIVTISSWNNGDTCVTEFAEIKMAIFVPSTNIQQTVTLSGNPQQTVTLVSSSSPLAGLLLILG